MEDVSGNEQRPIVDPDPYTVCPHRTGDIAELLFAQIVERNIELAGGVFPHAGGDANLTWPSQRLQPGGDIDAVPEDVAILDDNVPDVDPNTEVDAPLGRHVGVVLSDGSLHFGCAAQRINDALELDQ